MKTRKPGANPQIVAAVMVVCALIALKLMLRGHGQNVESAPRPFYEPPRISLLSQKVLGDTGVKLESGVVSLVELRSNGPWFNVWVTDENAQTIESMFVPPHQAQTVGVAILPGYAKQPNHPVLHVEALSPAGPLPKAGKNTRPKPIRFDIPLRALPPPHRVLPHVTHVDPRVSFHRSSSKSRQGPNGHFSVAPPQKGEMEGIQILASTYAKLTPWWVGADPTGSIPWFGSKFEGSHELKVRVEKFAADLQSEDVEVKGIELRKGAAPYFATSTPIVVRTKSGAVMHIAGQHRSPSAPLRDRLVTLSLSITPPMNGDASVRAPQIPAPRLPNGKQYFEILGPSPDSLGLDRINIDQTTLRAKHRQHGPMRLGPITLRIRLNYWGFRHISSFETIIPIEEFRSRP